MTFDVPTYEWGRDGGMDAGVTGHLGFTDEGCTMLYQPGQEDKALPLVFPNATGIRYSNGARAVIDEHGDLYGVEGQPLSYAGGWVDPNESWTATCGAYDGPEVVMVNDEPAHGPSATEPAPPDAAVPTRLPTAADLGWYDVPTFVWDPEQGGDAALLEGRVTFTDDGCAVINHDGVRTGLVLPNARGHRGDHQGGAGIYATFPEVEIMIAEPGADAAYGGGSRANSGELADEWARLCPGSPVDNLFQVYDEDPWQ
ncbi:hypothetical protein [Ornithinimicrobium pratense]|uniref:Uncharacterized protein n=1 Tax=Ornithinimicrobium pratense TaxID=2593973 RepID=A0A5J6V3A1_9MICO|nr:hypothetical protein [Ornithinimicrobium pratense]QFG68168.1 hypothetical protein FY030_05060 [Ornithinimicrobium pratense]